MTDDLGCWYMVDVSKSDFSYWLDQQKAKHKVRSTPKRDLARLAANELWPNGRPEDLINKQVIAQMADRIAVYCKRNNFHRPDISPDTLLRAAGRKK